MKVNESFFFIFEDEEFVFNERGHEQVNQQSLWRDNKNMRSFFSSSSLKIAYVRVDRFFFTKHEKK